MTHVLTRRFWYDVRSGLWGDVGTSGAIGVGDRLSPNVPHPYGQRRNHLNPTFTGERVRSD